MPKDPEKIEIEISEEEEQTLRQQVLSDVDNMAQKGVRFSPWWWRQLAQEDKALEVEALLFNSAAKPTPAKGSKKRKERAGLFRKRVSRLRQAIAKYGQEEEELAA